jgi:hypothetical protein
LYQNYLENHKPLAAAAPRPAQVHRTADCTINAGLYERLEQALTTLGERIKERQWQADWDACREHMGEAQLHAQGERWQDAFRAECRAMLCLMEAVGQQRQKEETFKPLWDRAPV